MARREIAFSVSKTPTPCRAAASKCGQRVGLRFSCSSSTGRMLRMSRLLYWKMTGVCSIDIPSSARFARRLFTDSMFASSMAAWLSATKTTPSTPLSTSLRVAL
jgi:hypothetical protein